MILQKPHWRKCRVLPWLEVAFRIFQFVDSIVSLITWTLYLQTVGNKDMASNLHTVLGVLVTASLWTLPMMFKWAWQRRFNKGNAQRWTSVVMYCIAIAALDLVFVILSAAVAGETGKARCRKRDSITEDDQDDDNDGNDDEVTRRETAMIFGKKPQRREQLFIRDNLRFSSCPAVRGVFGLAVANVFALCASSILNILLSLQGPPNQKHLLRNFFKFEERPYAAIVEEGQQPTEHDNKPPYMVQHEIVTSQSPCRPFCTPLPPHKPETAAELHSPIENNASDGAGMEAVASPVHDPADQGAPPNSGAAAGYYDLHADLTTPPPVHSVTVVTVSCEDHLPTSGEAASYYTSAQHDVLDPQNPAELAVTPYRPHRKPLPGSS